MLSVACGKGRQVAFLTVGTMRCIAVPESKVQAQVAQCQRGANRKCCGVAQQAPDKATAAPSLGSTQQPSDEDSSASFPGCAQCPVPDVPYDDVQVPREPGVEQCPAHAVPGAGMSGAWLLRGLLCAGVRKHSACRAPWG